MDQSTESVRQSGFRNDAMALCEPIKPDVKIELPDVTVTQDQHQHLLNSLDRALTPYDPLQHL